MDDDVRTQLVELQRSIDSVGTDIHDIKEEQARAADSHKELHREHRKLADRIEAHEHRLELHILDNERTNDKNELIHAHMTGATLALTDQVKEFRTEYTEDSKTQIKGLRSAILTILATGATLLIAILGLAFKMWETFGGVAG